jgi:Fe-S-cluster containining protein
MSDGCYGCSGRCCYDIIVRVTPFDVWRLATVHRLRFDEIVEPWQEQKPSELGVRLDASANRYVTVLRRHPVETSACAFLVHLSDEVKRCGVYDDRPLVCAVYPFEVARGSIDLRADARCGPGDWNLATLDYRRRRDTFEYYAAELQAAAGVAAAWNARPVAAEPAAAFAEYLAFSHSVCAALAPANGDPTLDLTALDVALSTSCR